MAQEKNKTEYIRVEGARVHNLKNISLSIPKNKLVVMCGVSGSGKSSLAFDTLYEEGQRRYLEGLSSYVRQFLGGFKKPDVDKIIGLSPTLAINQKNVSSNPRSTVGTITELYDHLRLLFARAGTPYCPNDDIPISAQTPQEIAQKIIEESAAHEAIILAPVITQKKGQHQAVIDQAKRAGYSQVRVDGYFYSLDEASALSLDKNKKHTIEVVAGKFMTGFKVEIKKNISRAEKEALKKREKNLEKFLKEETAELLEKIRKALAMGQGAVTIVLRPFDKKQDKEKEINFSEFHACSRCGFSMPKIEPRLFSFNSPVGACAHCQGLGTKLEINKDLLINEDISLEAGAIRPWFSLSRMGRRALGASWQQFVIETILEENKIKPETAFKNIPERVRDFILYGAKEGEKTKLVYGDWKGETIFEGVLPRLERLYYETDSDFIRHELSKYMEERTCPVCKGARLRKEALAVRIGGKTIFQVASLTSAQTSSFFAHHAFSSMTQEQKTVARPIAKEIVVKADFLVDVGLEYMAPSRSAHTLSVGENQRIRLATQLGSGLSGVIYVLDEPTVGLHPRDTDRLIKTLQGLRDLGNTVIVVEHDERVIEHADWVVEIGPSAGEQGGNVVFEGTPQQLHSAKTLTGEYLSGRKKASSEMVGSLVSPLDKRIVLSGASQFNLKNITLSVPQGKFVCVAGVSGSGKSTLVLDVLAKALQKEVLKEHVVPGAYKTLSGVEEINKVVIIDQSPIGRTPRSNPATYTGVFTYVRQFFTRLDEAQIRGYGPSYFSFNVKPGRCESCKGEGYKKVEMYFLPDMYVECDVCHGTRFSPDVLDVLYKEKSIADILNMTVSTAKIFFAPFSYIADKLAILEDIGLGYIKLGQPATTLSGGEAQRIKLADELARRANGQSVYILDEPTVGLHFDDVKKLLVILRSLVAKGNTVVVIEHNADVLREADWLIELGPEGGEGGGKIIFEGSLTQAKKKGTTTGKYL